MLSRVPNERCCHIATNAEATMGKSHGIGRGAVGRFAGYKPSVLCSAADRDLQIRLGFPRRMRVERMPIRRLRRGALSKNDFGLLSHGGKREMEFLQTLSGQAAFINSEVIPWVLRLVMVGLGLSLTLVDFKRVIVFPKAATIGLIAQLVGLPLAAFALAIAFNAPPAIAVGLVILAACPSGVTSNAYTFAARADVPLCVTLSAITSVVTVFTIPLLIDLALRTFFEQSQIAEVSAQNMLFNLITFTLLPLAAGMVVRMIFPEFAEKAVEPIRKAVLYLMLFVLLLGVISSHEAILEHFAAAGALVIAMNVLTMALGFGLAKIFKLPMTQVVTITFEVGVQNLALSFAITFNILQRPDLAVAALIYAAVMPATALAFVSIGRRLITREEQRVAASA
jgi:bile acid:Na+ symporter, BASS family